MKGKLVKKGTSTGKPTGKTGKFVKKQQPTPSKRGYSKYAYTS